jgi:chitinase
MLSWSSNNTISCFASGGWSGNKSLSGSETVSPPATTTYWLTCQGPGGSVTQSVTVTVVIRPEPPP